MNDIPELRKRANSLKLLYVEDNEEARESMLVILKLFFADIVIAVDGNDGLKKFKSNNIDLIITDINMPNLNGLEMAQKIKEFNQEVPILILSAHNESDYFLQGIQIGIEGYLLKPLEMEQFIVVLDKITSNLKLKEELRINENILKQYKEITDKSSIVLIVDLNGYITYANDGYAQISQYSKEELIGMKYQEVSQYKQTLAIKQEVYKKTVKEKQLWQGVLKFVSRYGNISYLKTTIKPIINNDGNIMEYITLIDNVTHIVDPNKQLFDTVQNSTQPVIVYMKIEEFRTILEFYDKQTIELIQSKTKIHLEESIKEYCNFDKVYQLGNGEYAMVNEKSLCLENKEKCISCLKEFQLSIKNNKIDIGDIDYDLSILISLAYEDGKILESAKLGINKQLETKQDFIVSNNLANLGHAKAEKNMKIISMVKKAIETSSIVSYFQPIIDNNTQKIVKYESLVRLIDEDKKELSPFFFLDIAKRGKYYSEITTIVLNNSFDALKHIDVDISINLSAIDIEKESTRETIFELLEKNKQVASRVVFELLEDEDVKDFETIKKFIKDVKEYGVKIAIDDFGSGYSNFERLIDYQPDILKIDGSVIKNIIHDSFSRNILETIVLFAKRENLQTVAEYVENELVFNMIKDLGVDYSQGYHFGKPEPLKSH